MSNERQFLKYRSLAEREAAVAQKLADRDHFWRAAQAHAAISSAYAAIAMTYRR